MACSSGGLSASRGMVKGSRSSFEWVGKKRVGEGTTWPLSGCLGAALSWL
jgi:hypothetical protein